MTLQGKEAALRTLWTEGLICPLERCNKQSFPIHQVHRTAYNTSFLCGWLQCTLDTSARAWVSLSALAARWQGKSSRLCTVASGAMALSDPEPVAIAIWAGAAFASQQPAN